MSKLSSLGQSMASLFTPESERLRSSQRKQGTNSSPGAISIPGMKAQKGEKPGDALGNPNSPGYEPWGRKKNENDPKEDPNKPKAPGGVVIQTASQGPEQLRISSGWEKILIAQKMICERAKALFTMLEGPTKYKKQKKSNLLLLKSRGCVLDLDLQKAQEEQKAAQAKQSEDQREPA